MKTITLPAREAIPEQPAAIQDPFRTILPGSSQLPQSAYEADTLLVPDKLPPVPTRRLVVLVPSDEIDEQALAYRVWQLADCSGLSVLYLAIVSNEALTAYQRRRLVRLAALTKFTHVHTDTGIHTGKNWSRALRELLQFGDLLVCLADDSAPGFFRRHALGERLSADLDFPVYQLGDLHVKPAPTSRHGFKNVIAWVAVITLMACFLLLQVAIDRYMARTPATIVIFLSVLVELFCLWKINDWSG